MWLTQFEIKTLMFSVNFSFKFSISLHVPEPVGSEYIIQEYQQCVLNGEFILGLIWGQPCYQWLKENYPSSPGAGGANLATASSGTRISFLIAVFLCHYFGCEVLGYHNINCADYAYPIKKTLPEEILCSQAWWYIVPDSPRAGIFWIWCIFPGDLEWCLCEVCSACGMSWRTHHSGKMLGTLLEMSPAGIQISAQREQMGFLLFFSKKCCEVFRTL